MIAADAPQEPVASRLATLATGGLCAILLCAAAPAPASERDQLESGGETIYRRGESPSGARITARVGELELQGAALACVNCHGEDGRGRREAGVTVPAIRWSELEKPWGHRHDGGREHGPFDPASLRRALAEGRDPSGNRLGAAMPRYAISARDVTALVAYLKRLDAPNIPGVADDRIRIGTWWPTEGHAGGLGAALQRGWRQRFDEINAAGGIHGRRLELVMLPLAGAAPDTMAAVVQDRVAQADVLGLLAPWAVGGERALTILAEEARVPVVAPVTPFPEDPAGAGQPVFHLLPGTITLAQVLLSQAFAQGIAPEQPLALLHAASGASRAAAEALADELRRQGWLHVLLQAAPGAGDGSLDALAAALQRQAAACVLTLAPGLDLVGLARAGGRIGWVPQAWLVPGPIAPRDLLQAPGLFAGRTWLAYPSVPPSVQSPGATAPGALAVGLAAGELLTEALKRAGRDIDRARLVQALESIHGFRSAGLPAVSFGPSRHVGVRQVHLVAFDAGGLRSLGEVPDGF